MKKKPGSEFWQHKKHADKKSALPKSTTGKVIVILGPTASGKSSLSVKIAKNLGQIGVKAEIVSADSRQVYKGLDIGTGKITKKEMGGIPHFGLDIANPKKRFTVTQFKKYADIKIKEIIARGHVPIICGGTGFYIDAVTKGVVFPEVKPNIKLRKLLSENTTQENFKLLKKFDKVRAKDIQDKNEINNNIRLIRAIEIAKALGKVPKATEVRPQYDFIKIGLTLPLPELEKKIKIRVRGMFNKKNKNLSGGLLKEIIELKKSGISNKRLKEFGFEYHNPTIESVILGSVQYAKRQMTWFKRDKGIIWFEISSGASLQFSKIMELVK